MCLLVCVFCAFLVLFLVNVVASLCFSLCSLLHARTLLRQKTAPPDRFFRNTWCKFYSSFLFFFPGDFLALVWCFFLVLFAGTSFDPILHCPAAWALLFPVLLLIRFCFFLAPFLARLCFILVLCVQTHGLPALKFTTLPILRWGCDWCSTAGAGNSGCGHEK